MSESGKRFILTLSCPDVPGIVHAVSGCLVELGCNIEDSAQFWDRGTGLFFMRVAFETGAATGGEAPIRAAFAPVAERFGMDWRLVDASIRPRVLIMVSKLGHCLNDLLYRYGAGALPMQVPAIVSNHRDFYRLAASYDIPFHHLPVTPENKAQQEAKLLELIAELEIDTVVLARYMQVLSDDFCARMPGRVINIHHSFLPSFKGARPYHQAHARGVKLIGATAHYVTAELDEGPIIEQEVERVGHEQTPQQLAAVGRDVECQALARAVKWHSERRVLLNGRRTVVFA